MNAHQLVKDALNTRNGPSTTDLRSIPINSDVQETLGMLANGLAHTNCSVWKEKRALSIFHMDPRHSNQPS